MGNLVVKTTTQHLSWEFTGNGWKLIGSSQHNKVESDFVLTNFSCQVYKISGDEEIYEGDGSGYKNADGVKLSISNVPTADLAAVAQVLEDLVTDLSE